LKSLSIRTKLVALFSALVAVPLAVAIAWLGLTAHLSVLDAGRALTGVADDSMSQSAHDVARLTAENAKRSSDELIGIGQRSLNGFAKREIQASEQTLRSTANRLSRTGSAALHQATERIAAASGGALNDANARLRHRQQEAIGEVSHALIRSSRRAFDRIGRKLTADSEAMVVNLASELNRERSHRTAELVQNFLQNSIAAVNQVAQEPRMLGGDAYVATRLRELVFKHRLALLGAALLTDSGEPIAQWPPPITAVPTEPTALPQVAADALATDQPKLSAVQFDPPGTPPAMMIAVALRGGPGRSLGPVPRGRRVLVATLSLELLSRLLAQVGDGRSAPVFVRTRDGQVLAHSEPGNVGNSVSLPHPTHMRRIDADSVVYDSGGGQQRQLIHFTGVKGTDGWEVVAVQPLSDLLAQTEALRRAIRTTSVTASNEMDREARAHAASLEAAALQEQRRLADETERRIREENRKVADAAIAALVRQQGAMAHRDIERVKSDSQAASAAAAKAMDLRARGIAGKGTDRIRSEAAKRARLGLASMHELASRTADAAAGRIILQSLGVLLVALLAALMVALLTARSVVRPITALAAGARSIAQGEFTHRVPIASEDELGQLAASFNRMGASIEASRTELEASNRTLAQEKRRIQAIVDNSPDGLLILNGDGSVGFANPAARSLLPWQGLVHGNGSAPLDSVLPPALMESLREAIQEIDAGRASVCDLTLDSPRRVLQVRTVRLETGAPVPGAPDGAGRLVHLHDVTLEREIDEMKSSFVMLVSHELRTPLTSILGFSSYMRLGKMGPLTEAQRSGLESIERQAHRLKAIAADFLDLSRIETGSLAMRREPVDVERWRGGSSKS